MMSPKGFAVSLPAGVLIDMQLVRVEKKWFPHAGHPNRQLDTNASWMHDERLPC